MKITFILPNIEISGGVKAVFQFANCLHDEGHEVIIVHPFIPYRVGLRKYTAIKPSIKHVFNLIKKRKKINRFQTKAKLSLVPFLFHKFIPNGDIVVATWWETAYFIKSLNQDKGKKIYLIQHYEIWGGPKTFVEKTYRFNMKNIVNSTWLKNILKSLHSPTEAIIMHSPDLDQFYHEVGVKKDKNIKILVAHRDIPWKGTKDAISAFEIIQQKYPDTKLVMFGPEYCKDIPEYAEFHLNPSPAELRSIYNSADIFLFTSHEEGFAMPPMEAMACKCAVVATNVGAIPDYAIADKTAIICPPKSPEKLAEAVIMLIEDEYLRVKIAENGHNHILANFSWQKSAKNLEAVFIKNLKKTN